MTLEAFHTQEYRDILLTFPFLATGNEQWLGDGYYFWQDYQFSDWWGKTKKCNLENVSQKYCIYNANLIFEDEDFIDTVFNETDYYQFVFNIERFAAEYYRLFDEKPDLADFNDFISDFGVWSNIKIIRFQDLPGSNQHVDVKGFYYKKRIQIRVNDPSIIHTFALLNTNDC
ncbi:hypothetical protein ACFQ3S_18005 [Mucilaginibacter terrae]|uniref:hypothetical protein n=1 Tax=Mucilaginibacter terrae TaxID=1955052 RepID=UPI003628B79C